MQFIDLKSQQDRIKPEIDRRISKVLNHGKYILGPEVFELEDKLCEYTEAKHCITVSSGTDALLISLMALGVGSGDEVITTSFSFISTIEAIVRLGASPVLVDIDPNTCNINISKIEDKVTKNTKAIMPVSLYGHPSNMDEINSISAKYGNIPVIEDAAQSFGSSYHNIKSCNLSTIGCTSFFPSKPLGCYGDGGAIFTNDDYIAQACREIRVHGQSKRYTHTRIGVGGRMDTLQCAIVLAKLSQFDWEIQQRRVIGERYNAMIDDLGVRRVKQQSNILSNYAQYSIFVKKRDELLERFNNINIPLTVHYPLPMNEQPAYKNIFYPNVNFPVAKSVSKEIVSIPMHPYLTEADQIKIIQLL